MPKGMHQGISCAGIDESEENGLGTCLKGPKEKKNYLPKKDDFCELVCESCSALAEAIQGDSPCDLQEGGNFIVRTPLYGNFSIVNFSGNLTGEMEHFAFIFRTSL